MEKFKTDYYGCLIIFCILNLTSCADLQHKIEEIEFALGLKVHAETLTTDAEGYSAGYELQEIVGVIEPNDLSILEAYIEGLTNRKNEIYLELKGEHLEYEQLNNKPFDFWETLKVDELAKLEQIHEDTYEDNYRNKVIELQKSANRAEILRAKALNNLPR